MPGRFLLISPPDAVGRTFDAAAPDNFAPRYNIAPTQPIGIVRLNEKREREFALVRWGFIPSWAKKDYFDRTGGEPQINARGETVAEKPMFRSAFRRRRCLIPADGFYEWRAEKGARQPYLFKLAGGGLIAFAGVWETAIDPDGGEIDTAAIITAEAGPDIAPLHGREGVVIQPQDFATWLDPDERNSKAALALIKAAPKGFWKYHPVSKAVNNARNEGESLAKEIGQREMF